MPDISLLRFKISSRQPRISRQGPRISRQRPRISPQRVEISPPKPLAQIQSIYAWNQLSGAWNQPFKAWSSPLRPLILFPARMDAWKFTPVLYRTLVLPIGVAKGISLWEESHSRTGVITKLFNNLAGHGLEIFYPHPEVKQVRLMLSSLLD